MSDLSTMMGTDPHPDTLQPVGPAVQHPTPGQDLPIGVHPGDNSVPLVPGQPLEHNQPVSPVEPGAQGERRRPPWDTDNEEALPVFMRAAHDWSIRTFTLNSTTGPIVVASRLKGCQSTILWVPATAALGCVIAPTQGELNNGAGGTLNPGDSIELATEGPVYGGVIGANATGTLYVVRTFNPPGGGLGLSAS